MLQFVRVRQKLCHSPYETYQSRNYSFWCIHWGTLRVSELWTNWSRQHANHQHGIARAWFPHITTDMKFPILQLSRLFPRRPTLSASRCQCCQISGCISVIQSISPTEYMQNATELVWSPNIIQLSRLSPRLPTLSASSFQCWKVSGCISAIQCYSIYLTYIVHAKFNGTR